MVDHLIHLTLAFNIRSHDDVHLIIDIIGYV